MRLRNVTFLMIYNEMFQHLEDCTIQVIFSKWPMDDVSKLCIDKNSFQSAR